MKEVDHLSFEKIPITEVVQLDQEFPLFDPKRVLLRRHQGGGEIPKGTVLAISSGVQLALPTLEDNIAVEIGAALWGTLHLYFGATPFNPEVGYGISKEDFDVELRIKKWNELRKKREERIGGVNPLHYSDPQAPLILSLTASHDQSKGLRSIMRGASSGPFRRDVLMKLKNIGLTLTFPDSLWEGVKEKDDFKFFDFRPSGTSPLAVAPEREWDEGGAFHEGVPLFVPDDIDRLALIKGVFSRKT